MSFSKLISLFNRYHKHSQAPSSTSPISQQFVLCSQSPPKLCGPRVFLWLLGWLQQVWLVGKHTGGVEQDEGLVLKKKKLFFIPEARFGKNSDCEVHNLGQDTAL